MKKPIKSAIKEMYSDVQLSNDELQSLRGTCHGNNDSNNESLAPSSNSQNIKPSRLASLLTLRPWMYGIAVSLCAVFSLLMFQSLDVNRSVDPSSDKIAAIVADVVDNHLLHKVLTYRANSLTKIHDKFNYLGFTPFTSSLFDSERQLVGAQPCFILKTPAAQLRYVTFSTDDKPASQDEWSTVFQARYQKEIYGDIPNVQQTETPLTMVNRGVKVSLWVDSDVLFAIAEPATQM